MHKQLYVDMLVVAFIATFALATATLVIGTPNVWSPWYENTGVFGETVKVKYGGAYQWDSFYKKNIFPMPVINYQSTDGLGVYCTYTEVTLNGYSLRFGSWVEIWSNETHGPTNTIDSHQESAYGLYVHSLDGICKGWFVSWIGDRWTRTADGDVLNAP